MMRHLVVILLLAGVLVPVSAVSQTEAPRVSYPYSVFNEKPLRVGDHVWVNVGDDLECTYNGTRYPLATDECLRGVYKRATVVRIDSNYYDEGRRKYFLYGVTVVGHEDDIEFIHYRGFDYLYEMINLPDEFAGWSKYFFALNW